MKKLPLIFACVSFLFLIVCYGEEPRGEWNEDVLRLFLLEDRDEALQKLLREARYPEKPAYKINNIGRVKGVKQAVICPQPGGRPLVTVFARSEFDAEDVSPRSGHFIVIRSDGLILPFYHGANSLDGYFRDLNGDGVMDYIDSWDLGYEEGTVTGLHLVPITEAFEPTLVVYWQKDAYEWRLYQADFNRIATIQIGLEKEVGFEPIAEYRWSGYLKQWQGPEGSPGDKFMSVHGDPKMVARKLIQAKQSEVESSGSRYIE